MKVRIRYVALFVAAAATAWIAAGAHEQAPAADLVVVNGRVFSPGGGSPPGEAVAVAGNKILAVGSSAAVRALAKPGTTVIDARGGSILPGFDDAHLHLVSGGLGLDQVNLLDATTLRAIEERIRAFAASRPDSAWVLGRGWYYGPFPGGLPTRQQLDALVPDRPAYMRCYDGHTGWANSLALAAAGITKATPDPKGGVIVRDPKTGEPTGALKESAEDLMRAVLPKPGRADRLRAVRAAIAEAHRFGLTSVQNGDGDEDTLSLFEEIRREGGLDLRVSAALDVPAPFNEAALAEMDRLRSRFGDDPVLKADAAKLYIDGVIEAHTAAMLAPYANRPTAGEPLFLAADLDRIVAALDRDGWQIWIHAIGDRGIRMSLDAFERAAAANPAPARGRRHRLEHIETIDPADIPRFGRLGVIAVQQPFHGNPSPSQLDVWSANIGPERASRGWAQRSIRDAGGRLAMGSDWPVVSLDPRFELHMAATRETAEGTPKGGWLPEQKIPLAAAVEAYTSGAAYASFDEARKGTLRPGMLADIVVMSKDILALPPEGLLEAVVDWTIFDGRVVYNRPSRPAQDSRGDRVETAWIADPEIRAGVETAIQKNLFPSATEAYYPGFFQITADGKSYGGGSTWPGLDSWQMAGAYLLLGRTRLVLDYFDFVRASQRKDGNIPFAIFTGDTRPEPTFLRGLKYPDDVFVYPPPVREGVPASALETRKWIGLFEHWQPKANSLGALGTVSYILTAGEIVDAVGSGAWLRERRASIEAAAEYLWRMRGGSGLVGGSGFYVELPPRRGFDGITQCYSIRAFRETARLAGAAGDAAREALWAERAETLRKTFLETFWRGDHFAEYVHFERGLVDSHGLSDVNWAAAALDVATGPQLAVLWPRLAADRGFRPGNMPTLTVTRPFSYEVWEYNEPVGFELPVTPVHDVASMGRAWFLEATARLRMGDRERLIESTRLVCQAAKADGYWRERYHPRPDGTVSPAGAQRYCEYPAVLIRIVMGNWDVFGR